MRLPYLALVIMFSTHAFAEVRTFQIHLGTQPCVRDVQEGVTRCDRASFQEPLEVQLDLDGNASFSRVFTANQLSTPYDFYAVFTAKRRAAHEKIMIQAILYGA